MPLFSAELSFVGLFLAHKRFYFCHLGLAAQSTWGGGGRLRGRFAGGLKLGGGKLDTVPILKSCGILSLALGVLGFIYANFATGILSFVLGVLGFISANFATAPKIGKKVFHFRYFFLQNSVLWGCFWHTGSKEFFFCVCLMLSWTRPVQLTYTLCAGCPVASLLTLLPYVCVWVADVGWPHEGWSVWWWKATELQRPTYPK